METLLYYYILARSKQITSDTYDKLVLKQLQKICILYFVFYLL